MTHMKKDFLWLISVLLFWGMLATSCSSSDDGNSPLPEPEPEPKTELPPARVTETVRYEKEKTTAYNIEYPSTDPLGNPVVLSGTITVGDEVDKDHPGRGLLLYNHFTVYRANQCPSKGNLDVEKFMTGSGLITISADYYGFGITEDRQQAYCISRANAQASVDALLAAKQLLKELGYSWNDDILFNVGYSQGGQTAMGVVRLVDEKYPDLHITYTFAGGGSYDIPETYRQFIRSGKTGMPSTVISVLLAYNEYAELGIPRSEIFKEPVLSHIDEWILSKRYTRSQIDDMVGTQTIADFATPTMLDLDSDLSQRYMQALEHDNLCKGWTPRKDNHIMLVHHEKDITVPVENTRNLYKFLKDAGVEDVELHDSNYFWLFTQPAHESGAIVMATYAVEKVTKILGIKTWFNIDDLAKILF